MLHGFSIYHSGHMKKLEGGERCGGEEGLHFHHQIGGLFCATLRLFRSQKEESGDN